MSTKVLIIWEICIPYTNLVSIRWTYFIGSTSIAGRENILQLDYSKSGWATQCLDIESLSRRKVYCSCLLCSNDIDMGFLNQLAYVGLALNEWRQQCLLLPTLHPRTRFLGFYCKARHNKIKIAMHMDLNILERGLLGMQLNASTNWRKMTSKMRHLSYETIKLSP